MTMSSAYLREVLGAQGDKSVLDLSVKINEIIQEISVLKADVNSIIDDRSLTFKPFQKENEALKSKAEKLLNEFNTVQCTITDDIKPKLNSCKKEVQDVCTQMKELSQLLDILDRLSAISSLYKTANAELGSREFFKCSKSVTDLQNAIRENRKMKELEVFRLLMQESVLIYEQLLFHMAEMWSSCVIFSVEKQHDSTEVVVKVNQHLYKEMSEIIQASLFLNDCLVERRFSSKMMTHVFNEVMLREADVSVMVEENTACLALVISNTSKKPQFFQVFENIRKIIEFMKQHMNVKWDDGSFIGTFGTSVAKEFTDNLLSNCLAETIPSKSEDLEKYRDIAETSEVFQRDLQKAGFLPSNVTSIIDYANNINVLFANKCCQSYLNKARLLMKKDLHYVTASEEVELNFSQLPASSSKLLKEKLNCLQESTVTFPKCQISKSAEEIVTLVNSILGEMMKSQDLCAVRLLYTVRNIFEMYGAIVPLQHNKLLETIPQQVAIFHNNCIYFTHQLVRMACGHGGSSSVLKDHFPILLEEAVVLRRLATDALEAQVSSQRNQLVYILRDSGLATLNEDPKLHPNSEKSVRQCIRQLQILHTVWGDILPAKVYINAMGFLLDALLEELAALVLALEDISSDTATDLVALFTMVQERTPALFPEPKEVLRYARKWQRFKEVTLVLGGSLKDISERWSDGVGPLAYELTAEQVKHLIRALFQNTERRAALLARIK